MIAYGMTDTAPSHDGQVAAGTVSIPVDKGGCGQQHAVQVNEDRRPYVECDSCAPYLVEHVYGWAANPAGVPLTPDEMGEADLARREGEASYRMAMKAMGDAVGEIVQGNRRPAQKQEAPAKSLVEQIAALSAEDRAALGKLFAADQAEGAAERAAKQEPAPAKTPARRGRPPKTSS